MQKTELCIVIAVVFSSLCKVDSHLKKTPNSNELCLTGEGASVSALKCCPGYESFIGKQSQNDSFLKYFFSISRRCMPICRKGCVNGECVSPDTCHCPIGMAPIEKSDRITCVNEVCLSCVHGQCINDQYCQCHFGYKLSDNNECVPICEPECINSKCVAPGVCMCHQNYTRLSKTNTCIPLCDKCTNGTCLEPNKCICHDGFSWDTIQGDCKPHCESNCSNGYCIGPMCGCNEGFRFDHEHNMCLPICDIECVNSECIQPNYCKCYKNYKKDSLEFNKCIPICEPECINGRCTAPNFCTCFLNYTKNYTATEQHYFNECYPRCNKCTNGKCIKPGKCVCNDGFIWDSTIQDCAPMCQPGCVNGFCVKQNKCKCLEGFKRNSLKEHICEPYSECEDGCSLPAVCESGCNSNVNNSSDAKVFKCEDEGYALDNITRCQPICKPSCINSVCIAPDVCMCGKNYYKPSHNIESPICSLKPCKKNINVKNNIKTITSENNKTCFEVINSPVLKLYDNRCSSKLITSCYDILCVKETREICNMIYTCNITSDISSNSSIDENNCAWGKQNDKELSTNRSVGMKNILHKYVNEMLCLSCLCTIDRNRTFCLNDEISFQLCDCPTKTNVIHTSGFSYNVTTVNALLILLVVLIISILIFVSKKFYFIKKHSAEYVVEAYFNNVYGTNEGDSSSITSDHLYSEILPASM